MSSNHPKCCQPMGGGNSIIVYCLGSLICYAFTITTTTSLKYIKFSRTVPRSLVFFCTEQHDQPSRIGCVYGNEKKGNKEDIAFIRLARSHVNSENLAKNEEIDYYSGEELSRGTVPTGYQVIVHVSVVVRRYLSFAHRAACRARHPSGIPHS